MDAAQTWAVIGVLAAAFFGMMTIVTTLFTHVVRTEIGAVRTEIGGLREEMNARFQSVHTRLDGMDRDIHLLMSREFGTDRG